MSSNANTQMNTSIVYRSKLFKSEQDKLFQNSDLFAKQSKTPLVYKSKLFQNSELAAKQSKTQQKPDAYKSFCKVCQDSGKTETEYTSHNVRDKCGKTMCPTLLALECRNCFKKGHTVKYCPLLQQQAKAEAKDLARAVYEPVKPKAAPKSKNVFMILESDSEEEEEVAVPVIALAPCPVTNQKPGLNYSRIIDQVNNPDAYAKAKEAEMRLKAAADAERVARDARIKQTNQQKCAWADAESSDEEDEDEDEDDEINKEEQIKAKVGVVNNSAW